jgi:flagellar biogenesis protein FliO
MDPMPAVLAVLAVLAAALWWLRRKGAVQFRRKGPRHKSRRLQSIERLALGPQHVLHLVRLDDRAILLAQSPSGLAVVEGGAPSAALLARAAAEHA